MNRANSMSAKVSRYLTFRRGLGYRLKFEGRLLEQFGEFADTARHRGPLTVELALIVLRAAPGNRPVLRAVLGRHRSGYGSAGTQIIGACSSTNNSTYLHCHGVVLPDDGCSPTLPSRWVAPAHLRHALWVTAMLGTSHFRGVAPRPRRCRLWPRLVESSGNEVPQNAAVAAPSDRHHRIADVC